MEEQILYFAYGFLLVLLILLVIKTILFFKATRKRSLRRWFYFNRVEVIDTGSNRTTRLRKTQNNLSVSLLVIFILFTIAALLSIKTA